MLIQLLERLINKKYYINREDIENKLNVFYAMNKITDEEYSNLTLKVDEIYVVEEVQSTEENETQNKIAEVEE